MMKNFRAREANRRGEVVKTSSEDRNTHQIVIRSSLLAAWLGELLIAMGLATRDGMAGMAHGAEADASRIRSVTAQGAAYVIQEIGWR